MSALLLTFTLISCLPALEEVEFATDTSTSVTTSPKVSSKTTPAPVDADGDGWDSEEDCDDAEPAVHPDASEICDDIDNDCDTFIDEEDDDIDTSSGALGFVDADGDSYGDPETETFVCDLEEAGLVQYGTDCDDEDSDAYPGAPLWCDGADNDCDGTADNPTGTATWIATDGTREDWTTSFGTSSVLVAITIDEDGELGLCGGTWYGSLTVEGANVAILGHSGTNTLSGADQGIVLSLVGSTPILTAQDLTIRNGYIEETGWGTDGSGGSAITNHLGGVNPTVVLRRVSLEDNVGTSALFLAGGTADLSDVEADANGTAGFDLRESSLTGARLSCDDANYLCLYAKDSDVSINTLTVTNASYHGAVFEGGTAELTDVSITDTRAFAGLHSIESAEVTVVGGDISGNGGFWGAGVYVYGGDVILEDLTISGNTADRGAGLYVGGGGSAALADVVIEGNEASEAGGGIWTDSDVSIGVDDGVSAIRSNTAPAGGGAYLTSGASLELIGVDMGSKSTDNDPEDVLPASGSPVSWEDTATAVCDATNCK